MEGCFVSEIFAVEYDVIILMIPSVISAGQYNPISNCVVIVGVN